jgi:hypothetical protein
MSSTSFKTRAQEELRNYAIIAGYLFVCFAVLMLFESTIPGSANAGAFSVATAAVKALVLGKFILIGEAVGVGSTVRGSHLAGKIVRKSLQFLALLIVLTVLEELIVGKVHGRSFAATIAGDGQRSLLQMLAKCLLVLLILLPFIATRELSKVLGPGVLKKLLLEARN